MITTTFKVEVVDGEQIMDTEILMPIDKKIDLPEKYNFKELFALFHLKNSLYTSYTRHKGNPAELQETYEQLNQYAVDNDLKQITSGYNVYVNEGKDHEDMIVDIYIGIDQNVL